MKKLCPNSNQLDAMHRFINQMDLNQNLDSETIFDHIKPSKVFHPTLHYLNDCLKLRALDPSFPLISFPEKLTSPFSIPGSFTNIEDLSKEFPLEHGTI